MISLKAVTIVSGQKVSFDLKHGKFRDYHELYSLHIAGKIPGTDVGIPCSHNGLVVIDVDVPSQSHTHDGRKWMKDNIEKYPELKETYKVETPTGGCHFYLLLPKHIDPIVFSPRGSLAKGVDIKWNGYVVAPPTRGYEPKGLLKDIKNMSMKLMEHLGYSEERVETAATDFKVNVPLPREGALDLLKRIKSIMPHHALSYSEWIEGIFSICAAVDDEELREECIIAFTNNKSYNNGDNELALAKAKNIDPHGGIGTGTIIKMLNERDPKEQSDITPTRQAITTSVLLSASDLLWHDRKDGKSVLLPTEGNACSLVRALYPNGYHNRFDDRYESLYVDKRKREVVINNLPAEFDPDDMAHQLMYKIQHNHKLAQFKLHHIRAGLRILCLQRGVDPLAERVKASVWDGKHRIDRFFIDYCKATGGNIDYLRGVGRTFWRSLVYRIVSPGHKCDEIVILQGPEGLNKSFLASVVTKGHFYSCGEKKAFSDRDCLINMHKAAMVELVEMVPIIHSDADQAKGYITQTHDYVRQMFGHQSRDCPRSFMLIGTCNRKHVLTKTHGARRFLPISIEDQNAINIVAIEDDVDQMYAEAYEDFKLSKRNYGLIKAEDRADIVDTVTIDHPWVMILKPFLENKNRIKDFELYDQLRIGCALGGGTLDVKSNRTLFELMERFGYERKDLGWVKLNTGR